MNMSQSLSEDGIFNWPKELTWTSAKKLHDKKLREMVKCVDIKIWKAWGKKVVVYCLIWWTALDGVTWLTNWSRQCTRHWIKMVDTVDWCTRGARGIKSWVVIKNTLVSGPEAAFTVGVVSRRWMHESEVDFLKGHRAPLIWLLK